MPVHSQMKSSLQYIFPFSILMLCSLRAHTQNNYIDSLKKVAAIEETDSNKVKTLINLSDAYQLYNPDSGYYFAQRALALAEKLNFDRGIFWSIVYINKSLFFLGNYALELDYAFKAFPLGKKLNDPYTIGWANGMLGDCYFNLGEYDTALRYYREVIKMAEQNSIIDLSSIYSVQVPVLISVHQYDSALVYAKKGYELFKRNPLLNNESIDGKYAKSFAFRYLGEAFAGKADYDSALFYYQLSMPSSEDIHLEINKIDVYNGIAKVYKEKNNLDSGSWYAKKVLTEKIIKIYPVGLLKAANTLADIYKLQNKPDSTLKYLRIALAIKDSLFNREKTVAVQNIFFKEQEKQKEVQAARTELQSRYRMYFLIALLIISLIITGIIIRNRRIKQLQNMRNSIADDLHDDIGSTLTNISILSELSKQHLDPKDNASKFLTRISEEINTTSQALDDIIWSVNVRNDSVDEIMLRMRRYAGELFDAGGLKYKLRFDDGLSGIKLSMDQRRDLYLIFKEAVNNIYKHANASEVAIELNKEAHQLVMRIKDDGKGFDAKPSHRNGFKNMQNRAQKWKGHLQIESVLCKGTSVILFFPLK